MTLLHVGAQSKDAGGLEADLRFDIRRALIISICQLLLHVLAVCLELSGQFLQVRLNRRLTVLMLIEAGPEVEYLGRLCVGYYWLARWRVVEIQSS